MRRVVWMVSLCGVATLGLVGCMDSLPNLQVAQGGVGDALTARLSTRASQATVAIASLDGAPDAVTERFNRSFAREATSRAITLVAVKDAQYLIRGYLSAAVSDGNTSVTYVYDIFDAADQRRIDRVSDMLTAPGAGGDAWATVDDRVMASLAGRSADAIAASLSSAPATNVAASPPRTVD